MTAITLSAWILLVSSPIGPKYPPAFQGMYSSQKACEAAWIEITERFGTAIGKHLCVASDKKE